MKFSPKCRTKKLGMIYTIFGNCCSFLNREGAIIRPQIWPRKIPGKVTLSSIAATCLLITFVNSMEPDQDRQNVSPDLDPNDLML